jgi:hypothetical protein
MRNPASEGAGDPPVGDRPRPDGGEDDEDRSSRPDDRGERAEEESEGGFWPWSGRRRIRRLRRELEEVRAERDDLESDVEGLRTRTVELESELQELRDTVETVGRKTFPVDEFIQSIGNSVWIADDELANTDFGVGDAEVTLRARFAGAEEGLSVQLPDPDEEVDPETLSTVTFRVGRGVSRGGMGPAMLGGAMLGEGGEPGGGLAEVPDIRELSLEGATEELSEAGFGVAVEYRPGATPEGVVIEQDPAPFSLGPEGATVRVVVAGEEPES